MTPRRPRLSNLRITVGESPQGNPAGDIYGKVLESVADTSGRARIWFTSIPPELRTWPNALGWRHEGVIGWLQARAITEVASATSRPVAQRLAGAFVLAD